MDIFHSKLTLILLLYQSRTHQTQQKIQRSLIQNVIHAVAVVATTTAASTFSCHFFHVLKPIINIHQINIVTIITRLWLNLKVDTVSFIKSAAPSTFIEFFSVKIQFVISQNTIPFSIVDIEFLLLIWIQTFLIIQFPEHLICVSITLLLRHSHSATIITVFNPEQQIVESTVGLQLHHKQTLVVQTVISYHKRWKPTFIEIFHIIQFHSVQILQSKTVTSKSNIVVLVFLVDVKHNQFLFWHKNLTRELLIQKINSFIFIIILAAATIAAAFHSSVLERVPIAIVIPIFVKVIFHIRNFEAFGLIVEFHHQIH